MSPSSSVANDIQTTSWCAGLFCSPSAQRPSLAELFQGSRPGWTNAALRNPEPGTDVVIGERGVREEQEQQLAPLLRELEQRLAQRLRPEVLDQRRVVLRLFRPVEGLS